MRCNLHQASTLITELRTIAETVRAYGGHREGRPELERVPAALHLIAAHLESEMRSWAYAQELFAASFATRPAAEPVIIDFPELRIVPSLVAPHRCGGDARLAELYVAVTRLSAVSESLCEAIDTSTTAQYASLIDEQATAVLVAAKRRV